MKIEPPNLRARPLTTPCFFDHLGRHVSLVPQPQSARSRFRCPRPRGDSHPETTPQAKGVAPMGGGSRSGTPLRPHRGTAAERARPVRLLGSVVDRTHCISGQYAELRQSVLDRSPRIVMVEYDKSSKWLSENWDSLRTTALRGRRFVAIPAFDGLGGPSYYGSRTDF